MSLLLATKTTGSDFKIAKTIEFMKNTDINISRPKG